MIDALSRNNLNVGGAYLEHGGEQELIRGVGLIQSESDIRSVGLATHQGTPVYVSSVAEVRRGAQIRQGAATRDGKGKTVMGIAMMLKGEIAAPWQSASLSACSRCKRLCQMV